MARTVILTSDLSGESPASTHTFALDGTNFEIDLTEDEASSLHGALAPYLSVARGLGGNTSPRANLVGYTSAQVRAWARRQGLDVPNKGRVPNDILLEFIDAHSENA